MSIEEIKAMGKRLADHLASKHGIKLKHSAILEAMAVQLGCKDWNTLVAQFTPDVSPTVRPAVSLKDSYLLGTSAKGPCALTYPEMTRNLLISGQRGAGSSIVVHNLLQQQIRKGGGFFYLGTSPDENLRQFVQGEWKHSDRAEALRILNFSEDASTCCLNPLSSGEPGKIAQIALAPLTRKHEGADAYWISFAHVLLERLVAGLQLLERPVTFEALVHLLEDTQALARLGRALPESNSVATHLRALASALEDGDKAACSVAALILTTLRPFTQGLLGATLNGGKEEVDLAALVDQQQGLFITVDGLEHSRSNLEAGSFIIEQLQRVVWERCGAGSASRSSLPFLVFIQQAGPYVTDRLDSLLGKARGAGMGFVLVQDSLSTEILDKRSLAALTGFGTTKLFLQQGTAASARYVSALIGRDYVQKDANALAPEIVERAPADTLLTLEVGHGWLMREAQATPIRVTAPQS